MEKRQPSEAQTSEPGTPEFGVRAPVISLPKGGGAIRGIGQSRRVSNLMLMAGAIDVTCLADGYRDAAEAVDRISILSSYHDQVLHWAFPLGNFFAGLVTRDCPNWHAALGREGPTSTLGGKAEQGWQIPDPWHYGHHHYLPTHAPGAPPRTQPEPVPPIDSPEPD